MEGEEKREEGKGQGRKRREWNGRRREVKGRGKKGKGKREEKRELKKKRIGKGGEGNQVSGNFIPLKCDGTDGRPYYVRM